MAKSLTTEKCHNKCDNKSVIISEEREDIFIDIECNTSLNSLENSKKNKKVNTNKEEVFLELNTNDSDKPFETNSYIRKKDINLLFRPKEDVKNINKRNCYMLGKKRTNPDLIKRNPRNKIKSNKKLTSLVSGKNPKNQGNHNGPEDYYQINSVSPNKKDKSNNINNKFTHIPKKTDRFTNRRFIELESNNTWINWIKDVLSKNNQNHEPCENMKKVMEGSKPPITFKAKDSLTFNFSKTSEGCDSKNENERKNCENLVAAGFTKENALSSSNNPQLKDNVKENHLFIKKENADKVNGLKKTNDFHSSPKKENDDESFDNSNIIVEIEKTDD